MGYMEGWNSKDELVRHLTKDYKVGENEDGTPKMTRLLAQSLRGNLLWTAWASGNDVTNGKPTTFIVLFSMGSNRHNRGAWGYKPESEDMGPCNIDCPLYLLKVADNPNDSETAKKWREDVLAAPAKKKSALAKLIQGAIIEFPFEWHFQRSGKHSQLKVYDPKKGYFETRDGDIVKLSKRNLQGGNFTTIPAFS